MLLPPLRPWLQHRALPVLQPLPAPAASHSSIVEQTWGEDDV
jgi:hypothetical protein